MPKNRSHLLRGRASLQVERMEARDVPATLTVDATQVLRSVNTQISGVNLAQWDYYMPTAATQQLVQDAGLKLFRFPGGSASDDFHFTTPPAYDGQGTAATMANFIASVSGGGMVTLDYGSADPKEAAAFSGVSQRVTQQHDRHRQRQAVEFDDESMGQH